MLDGEACSYLVFAVEPHARLTIKRGPVSTGSSTRHILSLGDTRENSEIADN